jgi:hypothetical protein
MGFLHVQSGFSDWDLVIRHSFVIRHSEPNGIGRFGRAIELYGPKPASSNGLSGDCASLLAWELEKWTQRQLWRRDPHG